MPLGAAVLLLGAAAVAIALGDGSQPASSAREAGDEATGSPEGAEESGVAEMPEADRPDHARWSLPLTTADDVLIFDDGMDGAVGVDVQTGMAFDVELPQRAGDQPYRLWRVGEQLAVGWGEIHLVSLHPDGPPSMRLPAARYFVPAAEPDHLWLIGHHLDHGASAEAAWSLVGPSGSVIVSLSNDDIDGHPIRGVPGGLAVRTESGRIHLLDLHGELHTDHLTDGPATIADATSEHVVWCEDPCDELRLSTASGEVVATFGDEDVRGFSPGSVWLSDDGARLAAVAMVDLPSGGVDRELQLYRTDRSSPAFEVEIPLGDVYGTWTLDGATLYFAVNQPPGTGGGPQLLGWADENQATWTGVAPHLTGLRDIVVIPRDAIDVPDVTR
jgi:hypothetical protein